MNVERQKGHSRRDFLKHALLVSGAAGLAGSFPNLLRKAMAIEPEAGSTFLDAEHVVILMQENRSFDHCFGTLRGVRGFADPRAMTLPDGHPVWAQADEAGFRFLPFRLNISQTNATWLGDLPHVRASQVAAWNQGNYDRWIPAKRTPAHPNANLPLTMGYHTREDIPFYYALADAFTICDQYFSSVMSCTSPNRAYLWTGTVRAGQQPDLPANVQNEDFSFEKPVNWTTYPERLEDNQVSWNVYQNEIGIGSGFNPEERDWLANFGDNQLEYFAQYNVQFAAARRKRVMDQIPVLRAKIDAIKEKLTLATDAEQTALQKEFDSAFESLGKYELEAARYSDKNQAKLTDRQKSLHAHAFCTNVDDPDYRGLEPITYHDGPVERSLNIPKSDVLSGFRRDVARGNLPAVSWIVAPRQFSDHPSVAWFGAWYVSQVLEILTQNPDVWKKTIFILNYDENDGFFDHMPPFVPPRPGDPETGTASAGIDTAMEYDAPAASKDPDGKPAGGNPIGLGFRVPMIIASPWTRGGRVCSQLFDHTSVLQFLETWLANKTGKKIEETNISRWRPPCAATSPRPSAPPTWQMSRPLPSSRAGFHRPDSSGKIQKNSRWIAAADRGSTQGLSREYRRAGHDAATGNRRAPIVSAALRAGGHRLPGSGARPIRPEPQGRQGAIRAAIRRCAVYRVCLHGRRQDADPPLCRRSRRPVAGHVGGATLPTMHIICAPMVPTDSSANSRETPRTRRSISRWPIPRHKPATPTRAPQLRLTCFAHPRRRR